MKPSASKERATRDREETSLTFCKHELVLTVTGKNLGICVGKNIKWKL